MTAYPNRGEEADLPIEGGRTRTMLQRELIALTNDSALTRALQDLAADGVSVHVVPDMRTLSDELLQHVGAVAMIDAGSLDAPIEGAVDAITTQFPDLRLMIAGQSAEQTALARRIADQSVFRFVHKPASPQRLKLFLDAAVRMPAGTPRAQVVTAEPAFGDSPSLARIDTAVRGRSPMTLALVGVAAIMVIAATAWFFWLRDSKPAVQATAPQAASPAAVPSPPAVVALIRKADKAFADGRYAALDGTSAAEAYREAMKLAPADTAARSGLDRSIEYGIRRAEEALLAGRLNEAASVAEALRPLAPNNSRLSFLNTQIEKEQARQNADASLRSANEARQAQIRAALDQMNERMRRGALLDPAANNAVMHFRTAEQAGPGDPAVRAARESLVAALLTSADGELSAKRTAGARRMIDAAATLNSSAPGIDILRRRLEEFGEQQAAASAAAAAAAAAAEAERATEAERAQEAAVRTPAAVDATPVSATPSVVAATSLKLLRSAVPDYPQRAVDALISGWVEMEFTVARDGSVKDAVVVNAEPRRTFDSAALAALKRYRYQPVVRDGETVEQRARLRMRFTAREGR